VAGRSLFSAANSATLRQERQHGKQMADLYLSVIEALALAIDAKDRTTQRHVRRVLLAE